jgi:hypothetical protein
MTPTAFGGEPSIRKEAPMQLTLVSSPDAPGRRRDPCLAAQPRRRVVAPDRQADPVNDTDDRVVARPHPIAVAVVKSVHTAIFFAELASIGWLVLSGLMQRRDRSVAIAATAVGIEAIVFFANDRSCPLTPLTRRLGDERGSVSDIFLPDVVARTIPIWSTALLILAAVLHARSALVGRAPSPRIGA